MEINKIDDSYVFDKDENGFPAFTSKNINFINAIISNDSNYRKSFDTECIGSSANLLNKGFPQDREQVLEVVEAIDKENSTHLSVISNKKGENNNQGRIITANNIYKMGLNTVEKRIKNGDYTIVDDIAKLVEGKINISFASKFCTYVSRYCFKKDDYSIFDNVVCEVLPYYTHFYLDEKHWRKVSRGNRKGKKVSSIREEFIEKNGKTNYSSYCELIGKIINTINKDSDDPIGRQDFDFMLWYYFKGDKGRINTAMDYIPD